MLPLPHPPLDKFSRLCKMLNKCSFSSFPARPPAQGLPAPELCWLLCPPSWPFLHGSWTPCWSPSLRAECPRPVVRGQFYAACVPPPPVSRTGLLGATGSAPSSLLEPSDQKEVANPGGSGYCLPERGNLGSELAPHVASLRTSPRDTEPVTHPGPVSPKRDGVRGPATHSLYPSQTPGGRARRVAILTKEDPAVERGLQRGGTSPPAVPRALTRLCPLWAAVSRLYGKGMGGQVRPSCKACGPSSCSSWGQWRLLFPASSVFQALQATDPSLRGCLPSWLYGQCKHSPWGGHTSASSMGPAGKRP